MSDGSLPGRSLAAVSLGAALLAGTAACGGGITSGIQQPVPSTGGQVTGSSTDPSTGGSSASSAGGTDIRSIDPCALFPQQDLDKIGFPQGKPSELNDSTARGCDFDTTNYSGGIAVYYTTAYDQRLRPPTTPTSVNGRPAIRSNNTLLCAVSMKLTDTASVETTGQFGSDRGADRQKSCQLATLIAQAIEPNLPKD